MKSYLPIFALIILVIFISGCSYVPSIPFLKKEKETTTGTGLRLYFGSNAPPSDKILVGKGSEFIVAVRADNWGKEITGAELSLWDNFPGDTLE